MASLPHYVETAQRYRLSARAALALWRAAGREVRTADFLVVWRGLARRTKAAAS